jgi:proteasome accessory factor B
MTVEVALSKRRTERLLSIVVLLLSSRRYLTAEQIRAAVSGYPEEQEAFKRMFERDKEELRDLGIPLETGRASQFDDDLGYRISRQDYELPEIHLEPDEAAVLGIASRVWQSAELAGAATGAALKLRAASREADGDGASTPPLGIQPRLTTQEPAFGPLWEAVRDRRPVTFDYLASGRSEVTKRTLEPWGVVNRRGRWYVAGHDRARNAPRVFRLSRITGAVKLAGPPGSVQVPEGADVRELVKDWDRPLTRDHTATLRVRAEAGFALHRWGRTAPDAAHPGWDRITIDYSDPDWYAGYLAEFGPDVVVLSPPELREAVIRQLKGALT